jgi:phosphomevalonate kinase
VITVTADAPGKLFLTGEYAVLHGAPALVAAIDRRAAVRVVVGAAPGPLTIVSIAEEERCTVDDPERAELPGGDLGAVLAAVRLVRAWNALPAGALEVQVDSRPFLEDGAKLGLGRSAATVAAAVAALLGASGRYARADRLEIAVSAHALFQGGQGSGADVAAAVDGGIVEVLRDGDRLNVADRRLPGLELVVGWTREPASTVPLLRRFTSAAVREPAALRELCAVARSAALAISEGDRAALLESVDRSAALLDRLGWETGLPIVTPALRQLVDVARAAGAVAKPSGAGGGDCGIALADSPAQAEAVRAAWRAEGIVPLPIGPAPLGVRLRDDEPARRGAPVA